MLRGDVGIGGLGPAVLEKDQVTGWRGRWSATCVSLTGLALAGLAGAGAPSALAKTLAPLYCDTLPGAATLIERPERVMILANRPGVREVPAAFAELACAISARGPVMVGLDWPTGLQPAIDIFMDSDGGERARAALIANLGPAGADVSVSIAMIDMLERLRQLSAEGRMIRVIAYLIPPLDDLPPPIEPEPTAADAAFAELPPSDAEGMGGPFRPAATSANAPSVPVWKEEAWGEDVLPPVSLEEARETFMADMILEHAGSVARVLLLADPERARAQPIREPRLAPYSSLAMALSRVTTLSLDLRHGEGEAWTCAASGCSARPVGGDAGGEVRMLTVFPKRSGGFDGLWWVGRLSPSRPVGLT
jgi:hypothetical protein